METIPNPFRDELVAVVEGLTGDLEASRTPIRSSFLETCVFLLEEAEIESDLNDQVGVWLRNQDEVAALHALALPLQAVLDEGGGWDGQEDVIYQHTPSWSGLQDAAIETLRVLRLNRS